MLARIAAPGKPARVVLAENAASCSDSSDDAGLSDDARLRFPSDAPRSVVELARTCSAPRPEQRPPMRAVAEELDGLVATHAGDALDVAMEVEDVRVHVRASARDVDVESDDLPDERQSK